MREHPVWEELSWHSAVMTQTRVPLAAATRHDRPRVVHDDPIVLPDTDPTGSDPAAPSHVRQARATDVHGIARVHVTAWQTTYAEVLPSSILESLELHTIAEGWEEAVQFPPTPAHAVLVACDGPLIVGYAAIAPAHDLDADAVTGELVALVTDPGHSGQGHGSRLLAAATDILAARGFTCAVSWIPAADDARRAFLESAGWGVDGVIRELDLDGTGATVIREIRLATRLVD